MTQWDLMETCGLNRHHEKAIITQPLLPSLGFSWDWTLPRMEPWEYKNPTEKENEVERKKRERRNLICLLDVQTQNLRWLWFVWPFVPFDCPLAHAITGYLRAILHSSCKLSANNRGCVSSCILLCLYTSIPCTYLEVGSSWQSGIVPNYTLAFHTYVRIQCFFQRKL